MRRQPNFPVVRGTVRRKTESKAVTVENPHMLPAVHDTHHWARGTHAGSLHTFRGHLPPINADVRIHLSRPRRPALRNTAPAECYVVAGSSARTSDGHTIRYARSILQYITAAFASARAGVKGSLRAMWSAAIKTNTPACPGAALMKSSNMNFAHRRTTIVTAILLRVVLNDNKGPRRFFR